MGTAGDRRWGVDGFNPLGGATGREGEGREHSLPTSRENSGDQRSREGFALDRQASSCAVLQKQSNPWESVRDPRVLCRVWLSGEECRRVREVGRYPRTRLVVSINVACELCSAVSSSFRSEGEEGRLRARSGYTQEPVASDQRPFSSAVQGLRRMAPCEALGERVSNCPNNRGRGSGAPSAARLTR